MLNNDPSAPVCYVSADNDDNGTCTVNMMLQSGDQISVMSVEGGGLACVRGNKDGQTGFSGTLLKLL